MKLKTIRDIFLSCGVILLYLVILFYFLGLVHAGYFDKMYFYDDRFKCDLILEQRVACNHGCQIVLATLRDVIFTFENYEGCIRLCESDYYLDEKGEK